MIVVMEPEASDASIESVIAYLVGSGFDVHRSSGQSRTILGVVGDVTGEDVAIVHELDGVVEVVRVSEPYRLASRRFRKQPTIVAGPWGSIGGDQPWIAIEPVGWDERSGSLGVAESRYAIAAGRPFDAAVTRSRVVSEGLGALVCLSLNPQVTEARTPIAFVERMPSWGANHWIGAAERALERREGHVVMLEAGGEYPTGARTLEIAAIARVKLRTHLPLVVDVPTIAQRGKYCAAVAGAAIGGGADGVILRVWVGPEGEPVRAAAALSWQDAVSLAGRLRQIGAAMRS